MAKPGVVDRLMHAWNAFNNQEEEFRLSPGDLGPSYSTRPDRVRMYISSERTIIASIYARLCIDIAGVDIRHCRLDDQDRYLEDIDSGLNNCLKLEANLDQESRHFIRDIAATLFDKGVAAIVPVDVSVNPMNSGSFDIQTMRVGEVVEWKPQHVRVRLYNEKTGRREEIWLPKRNVGIVENPLFSVMNEPNSTLQRLIRKLSLLDSVDEQSASGKLDLIIQLPYVIKSETRRQQATQRREEIEFQLRGSKYGIAYTDGTEKITQLNRPAENNLMKQIEYLTQMLYGELGLTPEVMLGTANEEAMLNYHHRTIKTILDAIVGEMRRKFLTKTARTQKQWVMYFRDPFQLVPISQIAEIADKLNRNEIASSNEIRQILGWKPSKDPKADQLVNSNMPQSVTGVPTPDAVAPEAPVAEPALPPVNDVSAPDPEVEAAAAEADLDRQMAALGVA